MMVRVVVVRVGLVMVRVVMGVVLVVGAGLVVVRVGDGGDHVWWWEWVRVVLRVDDNGGDNV